MRAVLTVVAALVVSVGAGGCHASSAPEPTTSSSPGAMSAASPGDVTFLENMVVHHQQALELTVMVRGQSTDPQLVMLADQIGAQQRTQLQGCQAQLLQWEVPGGRADGPQDKLDIPGMADQATMDKLRGLRGPEFDTLWLQTMIAHHRGAITMARNEIEQGQSPEAISIARSLAPLQQAEIDQMNRLLGAP